MKCKILHESNGRMRLHAEQTRMTLRQADILEAYLRQVPGVTEVKIYDRTCDAVVLYRGARTDLIRALAAFSYAASEALAPEHSSRALGREYEDKLVLAVCRHYFKKALPAHAAAHGDHPLPLGALPARGTLVPAAREDSRCPCSTQPPSASPCCAATSRRRAASCSCSASAISSMSGRTRSPWRIWRSPCPSTWTRSGPRHRRVTCLSRCTTFRSGTESPCARAA